VSSYLTVNAASRALRRVLWSAYDADPGPLRGLVGDEQAIVFDNPTQTARNPNRKLSIWLYRITENEFLRNHPAPLEDRTDVRRAAPQPLDLSYLVTPFTGSGENDQLLLGKTLQVLHDNPTIYVQEPLNQVTEELRVLFCRLPLEEVTRIWEALREPYRLSVCYDVRVVRIDSDRDLRAQRVLDARVLADDEPQFPPLEPVP
jgi:uncharacterized protein DUF4255